jgi:hypothetical protein
MTRINYVDWAVAWPDGYTRPGLFPGALQKLTASPPPLAIPHRPVGHVKRDRPPRAGSRGTVTLGTTLHTGHLTSPASWQLSATAIPAWSSNCTSPRTVQWSPAIGRRRSMDIARCASGANHVTYQPPRGAARHHIAYVKLVNRWSSCADRIRPRTAEHGLH